MYVNETRLCQCAFAVLSVVVQKFAFLLKFKIVYVPEAQITFDSLSRRVCLSRLFCRFFIGLRMG